MNWGSSVWAPFFAWRVAVYFNLVQWRHWTVERLEYGHNLRPAVYDFGGYLHDLYEDGKLEMPITIFTALVALGPSLGRCCRKRPSPLWAG